MLRKSIKLLLFQLFGILLIVETVNCYGLGNVGNNNNNSNNNNDKESHHSTTIFGSSVPIATPTTAPTATSILSEYLATFSDPQSPQTTVQQQQSTSGPGDYWARVFGTNPATDVRRK